MASAQQATTVSGRVTNEAVPRFPAPASRSPRSASARYTGNDGRFTFTVPANRVTGQSISLVARRIGYPGHCLGDPFGRPVSHDFRLATATTQLEGVVVTALGLGA